MRYKFFAHYFVVTWLAVSFAASLVWLDELRGAAAEMSVLVIDGAEASPIAENLAELSKNLSFYDAVLAEQELIEDTFRGESSDRRRAGWNDLVQVMPADGSGLLVVTAWGENRDDARFLAEATTATLFKTAARYYNVKTEIDLRVIDGPHVEARLRSWPTWVGLSLVSGLVVSAVFFALLALLDRILARTSPNRQRPRQRSVLPPETFIPKPPEHWSFEGDARSPIERDPTATASSARTAAAPSNLPFLAEEPITPLQGAMARLVKEDVDATVRALAVEPEPTSVAQSQAPIFGQESIQPRTEEPTPEEYKRRLNALLSGKMD